MTAIRKWIRHNQGAFVGSVVSLAILVWMFGCESKVASIIEPAKKVNAGELNLELTAETARLELEMDQLIKKAELRKRELVRQDAIKQKVMDFALIATETGTLNPSGLIGLIVGVMGIGAVVDNRIKDKVIANRPLKSEKS